MERRARHDARHLCASPRQDFGMASYVRLTWHVQGKHSMRAEYALDERMQPRRDADIRIRC
jgi:hypothetical protein